MSTCTFPMARRPCGKPAQRPLKLLIEDRELRGSYCPEHIDYVAEALTQMGMALAARTGRKRRALYQAASGANFSMAEARDWLIEQGQRAGVSAGRISKDELNAYAAVH